MYKKTVSPSCLFSGDIVPITDMISNEKNAPVNTMVNININFVEYEEPEQDISITEPYLESFKKYASDFIGDTIELEPILSLKNKRLTILPIEYHKIWDNYSRQMSANWTVGELDFSKDKDHWNEVLSSNDRLFLSYVLAFFSSADGLVNNNLQENVLDKITLQESRFALGKQFEMENVHSLTYAIMLDTFIIDNTLKNKLINSFKTVPSIIKKRIWCERWINNNRTIAHGIIAFGIVEGIFFSGSFASIFWLKTRPGNIMPGLIKSNRFIARDEGLHFELAVLHYKELKNKLKQEVVYEILIEAVGIEIEFINESLPCALIGMNAVLMEQYIKYVADRFLVEFGYQKLYNVSNPFDFMNKIDVFHKSNFFEEHVDNYNSIGSVKIGNLK